MIREGIEDYEMLYMLRELLKQKGDTLSMVDRKSTEELLVVPESITTSMTEFTIDPRPILERRTAVAEMIEIRESSLKHRHQFVLQSFENIRRCHCVPDA